MKSFKYKPIFHYLFCTQQDVIKGFLNIRATNERSALKRTNDANGNLIASSSRTDDDCAADLEILKTLIVNEENMPQIEEKLFLTMEYRLKLLEIMEVDLLETFPYFFTDPKLVCQIFCVKILSII